jgi:flavin-binding protein dodecin
MSSSTYKLTTLIGESSTGIEDAVRTALSTSASKVHGQEWVQVSDIRANVDEGGTVERWQVQVEVAFRVDGS